MPEELIDEPATNKPFFSVVIPAYNCANLIKRPLLSLESQIFRDFELIVVDDCSTEPIRDVIELHDPVTLYPTRILQTPANSGSGVARQVGLDAANGKYVVFLDADDYLISPLALNTFANLASEHGDPDIVSCNFEELHEDNTTTSHSADTIGWLHGKAYKIEFLRKRDIRFHEVLRFTEDGYFNMVAFPLAPKVVFSTAVETYLWTKNPTSIVNSQDYIAAMMKHDYPMSFLYARNKLRSIGEKLADSTDPDDQTFAQKILGGLKGFPVSAAIYLYLYYKALESRKVPDETMAPITVTVRTVLQGLETVKTINEITSRNEWIANIQWRLADEMRTIAHQEPELMLDESFFDWIERILGKGERVKRTWHE